MSFFKQLIADATPKANTLTNATKNVAANIVNSKAVSIAANLGYKGLVNTVGVGVVLAQPAVARIGAIAGKAWAGIEKLAEDKK